MNKSLIMGIMLIIIGSVLLLPSFTDLTLGDLWPVLMLAPGILFFLGFVADRKSYGLLMPGAILTTYGLVFFYCTISGWSAMHELWAFYLVGPGIGFFLMYYFGKKETALLIPGTVLTLLGLIFILRSTDYDYLWPVAIILAGVLIIMIGKRKRPQAMPPSESGKVDSPSQP